MSFLIRTLPLIALALFLAVPLGAQEKESPIEKEVKANLKDTTKPFVMIVSLKIKAGTAAKFEAAFAKARAGTRKEKGNKAYSMNRSTKAANEYIVYERWDNFAALQLHLKAPYVTAFLAEAGEMLDGAPEVKVYIPTRE